MAGLAQKRLEALRSFRDLCDRVGFELEPFQVKIAGALLGLEREKLLAELVGASRPSVSTALAQRARDGMLERKHRGWLLDMTSMSERLLRRCAHAGGRRGVCLSFEPQSRRTPRSP